jgi:hypothetical protein
MSRDLAEKEREFIESLKADTGRDLGEWMKAIGNQNFAHRNEAIDWLRQQGFLFAWASWLERIHHNGGRPIYCDEDPPKVPAARADDIPPGRPAGGVPPIPVGGASVIPFPMQKHSSPARTATSSPAPPARPGPGPQAAPDLSAEVRTVIASAKAFSPLAGFLLRRIGEALPGTEFRAGKKHIEMLAGPLPFALLAIGGRDLKLAFTGPPGRFEAPSVKVRLTSLGVPLSPLLTHMFVLTDARQIDEAFLDDLRKASARVQGQKEE